MEQAKKILAVLFRKSVMTAVFAFVAIAAISGASNTTVQAKAFYKTTPKILSAKKTAMNKVKIKIKKVKDAKRYIVKYRTYNSVSEKGKATVKTYKTKKDTLTIKDTNFELNKYVEIKVQCLNKGNKKTKWSKWTKVKNDKYTPYSYNMQILNQYDIYSGGLVIIYIETNNPNENNLSIGCDTKNDLEYVGMRFDDIKYKEDYYNYIMALESGTGYVVTVDFKTAGKKKLYLKYEVNGVKTTVASMDIDVLDYTKASEQWFTETMNKVTNSSMSEYEKMAALTLYVQTSMKYDLETYIDKDKGNNLNNLRHVYLTSHVGPFWQVKEIDCWDSTAIMCKFADMLGLKAEATWAGYLAHMYATVYIDGEKYRFDACPFSDNIIESWDYVLK